VANPAAISTWFNDFPASTGGSTLGAMGTSTASAMFIPFLVNQNIVFNCMKVLLSASYVSSTVTGSQTISSNWGIYSNNASTLSRISSGSYSFGVSCSSVSATFNYPVSTNSAGYTHTTLAQTATAQIHSNFGTVGYRNANLVFGNTMSLTPGVYWLGIHQRYSSTGFNAGLSNVILGNVVAPLASNGGYGFASSASTTGTGFGRPWIGFGPYTSTGSAGYSGTNIPVSAFLSGIANTISQMPFITLMST
jgi:hypothetical protein